MFLSNILQRIAKGLKWLQSNEWPYKVLCSASIGWFSPAVIGEFRSSLSRWFVPTHGSGVNRLHQEIILSCLHWSFNLQSWIPSSFARWFTPKALKAWRNEHSLRVFPLPCKYTQCLREERRRQPWSKWPQMIKNNRESPARGRGGGESCSRTRADIGTYCPYWQYLMAKCKKLHLQVFFFLICAFYID